MDHEPPETDDCAHLLSAQALNEGLTLCEQLMTNCTYGWFVPSPQLRRVVRHGALWLHEYHRAWTLRGELSGRSCSR